MAATAVSLFISCFTDLSLKPFQASHHHHLLLPSSVSAAGRRRISGVFCCLVSGVDGGGVSDTRKSGFDREFSVIAKILKRIEPLDNSVISKGVSDSAKDSMKQTISTMLGLLPSDQFSVTVRVSKRPLDRLLASSIITGYTLWNAEYRISLMRNFDMSPTTQRRSNLSEENEGSEEKLEEVDNGCDEIKTNDCAKDLEKMNLHQGLGDLNPETVVYIQRLESQLWTLEQELHVQKQENMQLEHAKESNNDLLKYLRALDSGVVIELSRPSSSEVEEVIQQLIRSTSRRFFKEETSADSNEDSAIGDQDDYHYTDNDFCHTIGTSRDYLAKLLFWCMLLGHHLRGLENRVHLSCTVGLL